ncbi:MAG: acyl-CoA thioesterase [Bacteroidales bacterium]|nr:acyl-CoA thioesterase [Bacteroidales bacterium]
MKEKPTYAGTYRVRVGDINYGGHMGNDKALLLFHDARLYFLGQYGFSESDIGGSGLIMSDAHVYFKKEVFRGDELKVNIHIEDLHGLSFVMHYTVMRGEEEVMNGHTKLIAFDYDKRKVVKIPDAFLEKIIS